MPPMGGQLFNSCPPIFTPLGCLPDKKHNSSFSMKQLASKSFLKARNPIPRYMYNLYMNLKFNKNKLLFFLFFTFIFLLFFLPHADTDFGWHYRCGYELIHLQKPCIDNTFSYFLTDYKWAYP